MMFELLQKMTFGGAVTDTEGKEWVVVMYQVGRNDELGLDFHLACEKDSEFPSPVFLIAAHQKTKPEEKPAEETKGDDA